jgi:hypothetical protein
VITVFTGLATVLAPVLGGLAYAKSGYTTVFAMAFGFIGLDLVLRLVMIERREVVNGILVLLILQTELQPRPSQDPSPHIPATASGIVTSSNNIEETTQTPQSSLFASFPVLQLLRLPAFLAALWGTCVLAALLTAFDSARLPTSFTNLFLQRGVNAIKLSERVHQSPSSDSFKLRCTSL